MVINTLYVYKICRRKIHSSVVFWWCIFYYANTKQCDECTNSCHILLVSNAILNLKKRKQKRKILAIITMHKCQSSLRLFLQNCLLCKYILPSVLSFQHCIHLSSSNSTTLINHKCINIMLETSFNYYSTLKVNTFRWNLSKVHSIDFIFCNISACQWRAIWHKNCRNRE